MHNDPTNSGAGCPPLPLPAESAGGVAISHAASDPRALAYGCILREDIITKCVDRYAPVGRYEHVLDGLIRFNTFGAVREAVLATAHEIAEAYPQLAERIHARFGMSGWDRG